MKLKPNYESILEAIKDGRRFVFIYSPENQDRKKRLMEYKLRHEGEWQI